MVAWSAGEKNWLKIGIDQAENAWFYSLCKDGKVKDKSFPLQAGFNPNAFHTFRILNNAGRFEVFLDDIPAPGQPLIQTSFTQPGIPGLFTEDLIGLFDAVTYTIGWDEYDSGIRGWGDSLSGEKAKGNWQGYG